MSKLFLFLFLFLFYNILNAETNLKDITLDGVTLEVEKYINDKNKDSNTVIYMLPDSKYILQKHLAIDLMEYFPVILLPSRYEANKTIMGSSYHNDKEYRKKIFPIYHPVRQKLKYKNDIAWDYSEFENQIDMQKKIIFIATSYSIIYAVNNSFNKIKPNLLIVLSPTKKLLNILPATLQNVKTLWIGSGYDEYTVLQMQKKYGGEVMIFKKSGSGYKIFFRNFLVKQKLLDWVYKYK